MEETMSWSNQKAFRIFIYSALFKKKKRRKGKDAQVGDVSPGPLTRFILTDPPERVLVPQGFLVEGFGSHESVRGGRATITPYFQGFTRRF